VKESIETSYYPNHKEVRVGKLFEIAYMIYNKIGTIYGNSLTLPKQELAKVNYNLISRYLAYEDTEDEEEDLDPKNIIQKIIKRMNFLSDEFPYKLKKIEHICRSKKIFVFAHDIYNRITFYIRPYYKGKECYVKNIKGFYDDINDFYNYSLENIDYVIYIFFVLECFLPSLREKLNFSDQINIVLDFDNLDADSEFIRFLLYHMNNYFPLVIGKMHIVNYELNNLKKNLPFRMDLANIDKFRVTY
jgi:hypothetical protein